MPVPFRCQARAVPPGVIGSSAGNTGSSPGESRRGKVDADCGDIGQRYSTRRPFRRMSRIGPELTDQRYCVWGAIRTSGAIATVLGACIMLYPASRVLTFGGRVVGPGRAELAAAIVALVLRQDQ